MLTHFQTIILHDKQSRRFYNTVPPLLLFLTPDINLFYHMQTRVSVW